MTIPPDPSVDSPAQRHFIELATRPLEALPEIRDDARGELMGRLSARSPEEREAALEAALPPLAKVIPGSWKGKAIAFAAAWLVLAAAVGWQGYGVFREFKTNKEIMDERINRFMMFSSSSPQKPWKSSAISPAALEAEIREHDRGPFGSPMPTNLGEIRKKLDPDNGAWALKEANWEFLGYSMAPSMAPRSADPMLEQWWKLAEEAASAPRFEIYGPAARVAGMQALPAPATMLALSNQRNVFEHPKQIDGLPAAFLAEWVHQIETTGDQERLRAAIRVWERLCVRIAETGLRVIDFEPAVTMVATGEILAQTAARLGMAAEEDRIRSKVEGIKHEHMHSVMPAPGYPMTVRSEIIPGAEPDAAACAAGREMEYAFAERMMAAVAAILVLLALVGVWFESIRRGRRVNGLATGLSPLFDGRDGLWLVGLGVLAPIVWYWGITRLTPFGCRDMAIAHTNYPWVLTSAVAGLLLLFSLVVQTARWRISRRSGILGTAPKWLWPGWVVVAVAAILVPLPGAMRWLPTGDYERFFMISGVSCGIPLLWLMWRAGAALFSPGTNALGGVLLSRAVALPLLLATTFLVGAYAFLQQREKDIIATDPVVGWDSANATTRQETRSVEHLKSRFREVFGESRKPPGR